MKLTLVVLVFFAVAAFGAYNTCTLSGDPHFTTFDTCYHDFQGKGWFQLVQNNLFNVQAQFQPCNGGLVCCTRSATVKIQTPTGDSFTVGWGSWPNVVDPVTFTYTKANSETPSVPATMVPAATFNTWLATTFSDKTTYPNGFAGGYYTIKYTSGSPGTLQILSQTVAGSRLPTQNPTVTLSLYSVSIAIPNDSRYIGSASQIVTNGLCGRFDGTYVDEMTGLGQSTNPNVVFTGPKQRMNNPAVNTWGLSWAVSASGSLPPLLSGEVYDLEGKRTYTLQSPQLASAPTDSEQATLATVPFNTIDQMNLATTFCNQQAAGKNYDPAIVQNCLYDAAYVNDLGLAATNAGATDTALQDSGAVTTTSTSDNSDGTRVGLIVGLTIGCVAAVAVAVSMVLYFRLRKVKDDYSRALILRNQAGTAPGQTGSSTDVQFDHADNL